MPLTILNRRFLGPPGVSAGFNPSHIAAGSGVSGQNFFSAVCSGAANMNNVLTGAKGTTSGVTRVLDSTLGIACSIGSAGSVNFANSGTCPATMTFGAVCKITTSNTNALVSTSTGTGGMQMLGGGGSNTLGIQLGSGAGSLPQTTPLIINVPWFVAASCNLANTANYLYSYVAVRLDTGQVYPSTGTSNSSSSGTLTPTQTGGAVVGGFTTFGTTRFAAAMMSPIYLNVEQLLQWAADPWGFWYPTTPGIFYAEITAVIAQAPVIVPTSGPVFSDFAQVAYDSVILG